MGQEASCTAIINRKSVSGQARLETDTLEFRAPGVTLTIPFKQMKKVNANAGVLSLTSPQGPVSFKLGTAAPKWADKIQHPPSRFEKLGVKPDSKVSVLGVDAPDFLQELEEVVSSLSIGRAVKRSDIIFFGVTHESELTRLAKLKESIVPAGAIWVVRPKGRPEISERAVMAAGKAVGLVDVKVVSFSATHTAEKFVIPLSAR